MKRVDQMKALHLELDACRACPKMIGPVVHGPPVLARVMLIGQAPGPREGSFGRPFAWTAGRTLFRWFEESLSVKEEDFRANVYMAAVARCFPGKAKGGGDRKPDREEIASCKPFLEREVAILKPELVLAVGGLAITEVLGELALENKPNVAKRSSAFESAEGRGDVRQTRKNKKLDVLVGQTFRTTWHDHETDVIALPHPSGASPWHKMEPGKTLLLDALANVKRHPAIRATFG